jgi:hypothetical protein
MLARWMGRSLDKWGGRREIRSLGGRQRQAILPHVRLLPRPVLPSSSSSSRGVLLDPPARCHDKSALPAVKEVTQETTTDARQVDGEVVGQVGRESSSSSSVRSRTSSIRLGAHLKEQRRRGHLAYA